MNIKCRCGFCKSSRNIRLTPEKEVWIEIPKNGSATLKTYMGFNHNIAPNKIKDYSSGFAVLRDPIDRFKSLLAHYFLEGGERYRYGKKWLFKHYRAIKTDEVNLADIILQDVNKLVDIQEPHHWNSQCTFIPQDFFEINPTFYDISEISSKFDAPITNTSPSQNIKLSDSAIELIKKHYEDDFILYEKYITNR